MKYRLGTALVLFVLLLGACGKRDSGPAEEAGDLSPYLNTRPGVEYVGKEACRDCHIPQYDTYMQTAMGQSFRTATYANSHADWNNPAPIYDPLENLYYQPFRRDSLLFVMEYRLSGRDTVHKRIEQIDYIVGSGHHTNSHIMDVNGYLYQVPVTYYTQDGKWDLAPGFQEGNSRFNRVIALECMTCHNARPGFVENSENRFSHVPHGIDCEQCHGPGALHVEWMNTGRLVDTTKAIDYSIVNPRRLDPDVQYSICQRCHMQGAAVLRDGKSFLDFRPGTDLSETLDVFWPRFADSVQHFIMASHPDRLEMSECFRTSWAEESPYNPLTCVTCHNPHVDADTVNWNATCNSCHTPQRDNLCTEDLTVRLANGDNCVACHMPLTPSIDIPHIRITDHYIRVRQPGDTETIARDPETGLRLSPADVAATQEFFGLRSLVDKDPTIRELGDGYLTFYEQFISQPRFLDSAAVYLRRAMAENTMKELTPSLVRLWFLQGDSRSVIERASTLDLQSITDPWLLYRIGESYFKEGNFEASLRYYTRAVSLAPFHLRFLSKLGQAYAANDELTAAISIYDRIIEANPNFSVAYNNRGFARVLLNDLESAEQDFLKALSHDPDEVQPMANLASLYLNTGRPHLARPLAARLIELEPANPNFRRLLQLVIDAATSS